MRITIGRARPFWRASSKSLTPSGPPPSAEAQAIIDHMTTPPSAPRVALIDALVVALKSAGVWTALDVLYITAAADAQAASINWKSPGDFSLVPAGIVAAPVFTPDRGYMSATDSWISTQWNPTVSGVNYVLGEASLWLWSCTDIGSTQVDCGDNATGQMIVRSAIDAFIAKINDGTLAGPASTNGAGFFGIQRIAVSGPGSKRNWRNGVQMSSLFVGVSSRPNVALAMCGNGTAGTLSQKQQAAFAAGASCTGNEVAFYNAMLAYMQGVGAA